MENYFKKLNEIQCKVESKNWLSYVSWADAWWQVKELYPNANYKVYENNNWLPFFESSYWIFVKVWVTINDIEHINILPVLDFKNKSMKENATSFDINKSIQRCFAKAIAMHWIWLYVYRWEDLPDIDWEHKLKNCKTIEELQENYLKSPRNKELAEIKDILKTNLTKWIK